MAVRKATTVAAAKKKTTATKPKATPKVAPKKRVKKKSVAKKEPVVKKQKVDVRDFLTKKFKIIKSTEIVTPETELKSRIKHMYSSGIFKIDEHVESGEQKYIIAREYIGNVEKGGARYFHYDEVKLATPVKKKRVTKTKKTTPKKATKSGSRGNKSESKIYNATHTESAENSGVRKPTRKRRTGNVEGSKASTVTQTKPVSRTKTKSTGKSTTAKRTASTRKRITKPKGK